MHQLVLAGFSLRLTVDSKAERRLGLHEPVSLAAAAAPVGSEKADVLQMEGSVEPPKKPSVTSMAIAEQGVRSGIGVTDIPTVRTVLVVKVPRLPLRKLLLEEQLPMPASALLEQLTAATTPFCYRLREAAHAYVLQHHNASGDESPAALMTEALAYAILVQQQLWVDQMILLQGQVNALATSVSLKQEHKVSRRHLSSGGVNKALNLEPRGFTCAAFKRTEQRALHAVNAVGMQAVLDQEGKRLSAAVPWLFFFFFGLQIALVFHLTYNVFSWDIMEPITYFIATAQVAAAYAYHAAFKRSLSPRASGFCGA